MTYCVAISTNSGLAFCSDSRTNAGPDILASYSKMHVFQPTEDRLLVILAAGNLATTQAIISRVETDIEDNAETSLKSCKKMLEAARYVAHVCREETERAQASTAAAGVDMSVSLILGGQIKSGAHGIFLIYSAGNFIAESDETPFLQIGESKYGKPILVRLLNRETSVEDAARCALVSMDSTVKSNATVGPPIELLVYKTGSFSTEHYIKLEDDDEYMRDTKLIWNEALSSAFSKLPKFAWEQNSEPGLHAVTDNYSPAKGSSD